MKQYQIEITAKYTIFYDAETAEEAVREALENFGEADFDSIDAEIQHVDSWPALEA